MSSAGLKSSRNILGPTTIKMIIIMNLDGC